ncbi:MAG: hypothetical protein R3231_02435 [bacterium]|nr:hypothetical protein [bacterium]
MIFPGRKALMQGISTLNMSVEDLMSEFSKQVFSGYAEFLFEQGRGIVLFHSGEIVTAIFKKQDIIKSQDDAIKAIKNTCRLEEGTVNAYQLPGEMAHMLRGLCNRTFVDEVDASSTLRVILDHIRQNNQTGTLEILFTNRKEKGMIILVNGRMSNTFLEMGKHLTLEGKDALDRICQIVDEPDGDCKVFQSEFSQEIWKSRRGTGKAHESRMYQILTRKENDGPSPMVEALTTFLNKVNNPPFSAIIDDDGSCLARVPAEKNGESQDQEFGKLITEAVSVFEAADLGEMKEILCTSQDKNLLIRTIADKKWFHILILEKSKHPKDLRKHLLALDEAIARLPELATA